MLESIPGSIRFDPCSSKLKANQVLAAAVRSASSAVVSVPRDRIGEYIVQVPTNQAPASHSRVYNPRYCAYSIKRCSLCPQLEINS